MASLGERDYYFDHGQDLFDPSLRPMIVALPGRPERATASLRRSTSCPLLDAVKVSYPRARGSKPAGAVEAAARLFWERRRPQPARHLRRRFKLVATRWVTASRWASTIAADSAKRGTCGGRLDDFAFSGAD
jgi:hypothetical protein